MKFVVAALIITVLILMMSCSTPYRKPLLDPDDSTFDGVTSIIDRDGRVDVLSVHGMCTHGDEWVEKTVDRIASHLPNWSSSDTKKKNVDDVLVHITDFRSQDGNSVLRNFSIVWSGLTTPIKQELCYDSSVVTASCLKSAISYDRTRASLNSELKSKLLNDCFSDAVIYLGPAGPEIRHSLARAIDFVSTYDESDEDQQVVLISESLGSKILADALLQDAPNKENRLEFFAPTELVFMAANQIPLLELADDVEDKDSQYGSSFEQFLLSAQELRLDKEALSLQVIAFTDPNDLLSYELRPSLIPTTNVIVSNDKTWFGLLERPDVAHQGYLDNDAVWKLIMCGETGDCATY